MGGFVRLPWATKKHLDWLIFLHFCLSSMSTGLNSMSAVFLEDFYKPYVESRPSKARSNLLIRSVVVIVGIICALCVYIVEKLGSVLQVHWFANTVTGGFSGTIRPISLMVDFWFHYNYCDKRNKFDGLSENLSI